MATFKAGEELDALIAQKVMGWQWMGKQWYDGTVKYLLWSYDKGYPSGDDFFKRPDGRLTPWDLPSYSTDIASAWEVIEKLIDDGHCPGLIFDDNGHWALSLEGTQNVPIGPEPQDVATTFFIEADMWADTAPLAICRAALRTM